MVLHALVLVKVLRILQDGDSHLIDSVLGALGSTPQLAEFTVGKVVPPFGFSPGTHELPGLHGTSAIMRLVTSRIRTSCKTKFFEKMERGHWCYSVVSHGCGLPPTF